VDDGGRWDSDGWPSASAVLRCAAVVTVLALVFMGDYRALPAAVVAFLAAGYVLRLAD
jgi:hypothetical protein